MGDPSDDSNVTKGALQHLEEALDVAESDETRYHIRQALQLLGIE